MEGFNNGVNASMTILNFLFQAIMAVVGFFAPFLLTLFIIISIMGGIYYLGEFIVDRFKKKK